MSILTQLQPLTIYAQIASLPCIAIHHTHTTLSTILPKHLLRLGFPCIWPIHTHWIQTHIPPSPQCLMALNEFLKPLVLFKYGQITAMLLPFNSHQELAIIDERAAHSLRGATPRPRYLLFILGTCIPSPLVSKLHMKRCVAEPFYHTAYPISELAFKGIYITLSLYSFWRMLKNAD